MDKKFMVAIGYDDGTKGQVYWIIRNADQYRLTSFPLTEKGKASAERFAAEFNLRGKAETTVL